MKTHLSYYVSFSRQHSLSYHDRLSDDVASVDSCRQEATNVKHHLKTIMCQMKEKKVATTKESHHKSDLA